MFLALKEIKHEKLRYGLIIAMIVLISYLIFILTSLALGLAQENTAAIDGWKIRSAVLNKDSDVSLRQSLLTTDQVNKLTKDKNNAVIAETSIVAKTKGKAKQASTFIGLNNSQFISKDLKLTSGHKPENDRQVVVDDSFKQYGYKLNDKLTINSDSTAYTIVGFTHNAKLNISPIVYGTIPTWQKLRGMGNAFGGSAVVSKQANIDNSDKNLKVYTVTQVINKLPGYTAQNSTFIFMIGFLMIISLIIIAVFLYIITIQKLGNYAVLRAQGSPAKLLVGATFSQSLLLTIIGLVISLILTAATALSIPSSVPMAFNINFMTIVSIDLIFMAILGSLIPVRIVLKVDPVSVIGG